MKAESISIDEARKLALNSQGISQSTKIGSAKDATLKIIEHLGYVQIDTISVVERAHHHTLWNRHSRYKKNHLEMLLAERQIFEYWSHAAAYLPLRDYRFSLPLKKAIIDGRRRWYQCDEKIKKAVYSRIKNEGALQSKDFENHGKKNLAMWEWKPAKYALDQLFMEGSIMVTERKGFQKVYDLTERVLPQDIDMRCPDQQEMAAHLVCRFLQANGIGNAFEIAYLRQGMRAHVETAIATLVETKVLTALQCKVQNNIETYYVLTDNLTMLNQTLSRSKLKILSPFDNLVIQRKRLLKLFDFDYQLECYLPVAKRRYGYFCLPVLWRGNMVARIDCKADRKSATLDVKQIHVEPKLKSVDEFFRALKKGLREFACFNGCEQVDSITVTKK